MRNPNPSAPGGLRLVGQRRVVELQLVQRLAQVGVVVTVDRVEPGEHHRVGVLVAAERLGRAVVLGGHGVAHAGLADLLHPGDEVAHLADADLAGLDRLGADHPDLEHLVDGPGRHHLDPVAVGELAVDDADVGDHPAVGVVDRVEDQRPGRGVGDPDGGGRLPHDLVEERGHAVAGLGRDPQHLRGIAADDPRQLGGVLVRLRAGQVDLVEHRDDVQVGAEGEVEVGQRLGLDPLRRVDQQDRGLARLEGP